MKKCSSKLSTINKEISFHLRVARSFAMSSDKEMEEYHLTEADRLRELLKKEGTNEVSKT